uniref:Peptidase_M13 domain-containing protein n=1 Tax=Ascaris lumbricoides TaxID=6252 RepID=A0A0M3IQZ3_ASCLU
MKSTCFDNVIAVMQVPKMRWHGCVTRINSLMPMATSSIYVRQNFDHEAKRQVEEMIDLIMEAFVNILDTEDWLTPYTKSFAKEKVDTMSKKIGYPDYLNDSASVDKEYQYYKVFEGDYYRTKFQFYEMYQKDILERISMKVDRERWVAGAALVNAFYSPNTNEITELACTSLRYSMLLFVFVLMSVHGATYFRWVAGAALVNAFYSPNTNEIIFPAGILQPVFYDKHFPHSMNFGGIGVVIGHEITHGFDDRGRLYDNLGNIRQWWDNATIEKFESKAQCIEDQYSAYILDQISMRINGRSTKGENIADNGGLKQAYRAYKKYDKTHPTHPRLPGVNLTHDQLFFLNYAQIWCGTMNDKEAVRKLRTSEHSPGPIRSKIFSSPLIEFAALNCHVHFLAATFSQETAVKILEVGERLYTRLDLQQSITPPIFPDYLNVLEKVARRVKGPLSNSEDFAAAFNCPSGSPMNPEHKCRVW